MALVENIMTTSSIEEHDERDVATDWFYTTLYTQVTFYNIYIYLFSPI